DIEYEADHGVPLHAGAIARRPVARDADAGAHVPAAAHHRSDLLLPSAHTDADRAADHPADTAPDLHPDGNTSSDGAADHHRDAPADLHPDGYARAYPAADHFPDAAADLHPHGDTRAHATADHHPDSAADLLPDADAVAASHDPSALHPRPDLLSRLKTRLLPRVLIQRTHHLRRGMELAHIQEDGPRVDGALPVLAAVLDQPLQEECVRVARTECENPVGRDARAV